MPFRSKEFSFHYPCGIILIRILTLNSYSTVLKGPTVEPKLIKHLLHILTLLSKWYTWAHISINWNKFKTLPFPRPTRKIIKFRSEMFVISHTNNSINFIFNTALDSKETIEIVTHVRQCLWLCHGFWNLYSQKQKTLS